MYAQVIVDIVHENVARTFTYRIPEGMQVEIGHRVRVSFGYQKKEGIVIGLSEDTDVPPGKLKDIEETLEDYPAILPHMIELAQEMAVVNHCPLAETLRLMMPAEMRGQRIRVKKEKVVRLLIPPDDVERAVEENRRSAKGVIMLRLLSDGQKHPLKEMEQLLSSPLDTARRLEEKKLVEILEEEVFRTPGGAFDGERQEDPELTDDQQAVLSEIVPNLREGKGRYLLHGVTGSGKTEVFIRLVRKVLSMGKKAIILVPEIALTPQMVDWFRKRFGTESAVLHSRLSAGERFDEWRRIRMGQARVVIGARSAIFAPMENLGLIVVDEEHETTYMSDRHPRYDAREVAQSRCQREGATLVLASATPSVQSFFEASSGKYTLLEMPERVGGRPLPEVILSDMRKELDSGNRTIFSRDLQKALDGCMKSGNQAMLLMNHRGFHSFVSCRKCGHTMKCPNCDVSLTYHFAHGDGKLHCHYCGHMEPVPGICPECGSDKIRYFGAGTEMVEAELKKRYPDVTVARMDVDTTSGKDGHAKILEEFRSGRARILVGTQMIAKGLDFPAVTVVGVIAADMSLNIPDYRAKERTFQLLTQVAGRAGRGMEPGRVIIQTYRPEEWVIQAAMRQDYRSFYFQEMERRRVALYPPYTILARLLLESPDGGKCLRWAETMQKKCTDLIAQREDWQACRILLSLEQPAMTMLRGKVRYQVFMKLKAGKAADELLECLAQLGRESIPEVEMYFEYNSSSFM